MTQEIKHTDTKDISRRDVLKAAAAGLLAGLGAPVLVSLSPAQAAQALPGGRRVLIVYFSRSGNTREIASQIHGLSGADMVELQTVTPYPSEYDALTKQAKQEMLQGVKPALKTTIADFASHDIIFVGSPNWWNTFAPAVRTFLSQYDFAGKTIAPFITHEGSGLGASVEDIKKLCPKANVLESLAVRGKSVKSAQNDVAQWLGKLGMLSERS
ncbi:MAG: twin-arginine translocation signal domain-containing protein [Desulfovibrio sp.]|nr:twin-arginine translocation signal domain-containing protein [Desulfovibrio sp.]